jgi:GNAT superfamily N-acetyltransferase
VPPEVIRRKITLGEIAIAEIDATRFGYLRLEYLWSRLPYIGLIWVDEQRRRQGIGRAVLEFIEKGLVTGDIGNF